MRGPPLPPFCPLTKHPIHEKICTTTTIVRITTTWTAKGMPQRDARAAVLAIALRYVKHPKRTKKGRMDGVEGDGSPDSYATKSTSINHRDGKDTPFLLLHVWVSLLLV